MQSDCECNKCNINHCFIYIEALVLLNLLNKFGKEMKSEACLYFVPFRSKFYICTDAVLYVTTIILKSRF